MYHIFNEYDITNQDLELLCTLNSEDVYKFVFSMLIRKGYTEVDQAESNDRGFLYSIFSNENCPGLRVPVIVVIHLDRVHEFYTQPTFSWKDLDTLRLCQSVDERVLVVQNSNGTFDDRAGLIALLALINKYNYYPHIVLTGLEEYGCEGSLALVEDYPNIESLDIGDVSCLIQFDRRGFKQAVYYDFIGERFQAMISSIGFQTEQGSYSDIAVLAPVWNRAAVNLSVCYYNEHTDREYLNVFELKNSIKLFARLMNTFINTKNVIYPYVGSNNTYNMLAGRYSTPSSSFTGASAYNNNLVNYTTTEDGSCLINSQPLNNNLANLSPSSFVTASNNNSEDSTENDVDIPF